METRRPTGGLRGRGGRAIAGARIAGAVAGSLAAIALLLGGCGEEPAAPEARLAAIEKNLAEQGETIRRMSETLATREDVKKLAEEINRARAPAATGAPAAAPGATGSVAEELAALRREIERLRAPGGSAGGPGGPVAAKKPKPEDPLKAVKAIIAGADKEHPFPAALALAEVIAKTPGSAGALLARRTLDRWGLEGLEITEANREEVESRIRKSREATDRLREAFRGVGEKLLSADEATLREGIRVAAEIASNETPPADEVRQQAKASLMSLGLQLPLAPGEEGLRAAAAQVLKHRTEEKTRMDQTTKAMQAFREATRLQREGDLEGAKAALKKIVEEFPGTGMARIAQQNLDRGLTPIPGRPGRPGRPGSGVPPPPASPGKGGQVPALPPPVPPPPVPPVPPPPVPPVPPPPPPPPPPPASPVTPGGPEPGALKPPPPPPPPPPPVNDENF